MAAFSAGPSPMFLILPLCLCFTTCIVFLCRLRFSNVSLVLRLSFLFPSCSLASFSFSFFLPLFLPSSLTVSYHDLLLPHLSSFPSSLDPLPCSFPFLPSFLSPLPSLPLLPLFLSTLSRLTPIFLEIPLSCGRIRGHRRCQEDVCQSWRGERGACRCRLARSR